MVLNTNNKLTSPRYQQLAIIIYIFLQNLVIIRILIADWMIEWKVIIQIVQLIWIKKKNKRNIYFVREPQLSSSNASPPCFWLALAFGSTLHLILVAHIKCCHSHQWDQTGSTGHKGIWLARIACVRQNVSQSPGKIFLESLFGNVGCVSLPGEHAKVHVSQMWIMPSSKSG